MALTSLMSSLRLNLRVNTSSKQSSALTARRMSNTSSTEAHDALLRRAVHLHETTPKELLKCLPEGAEWVLIGEATHGSRECYKIRAELTKELIENQGFHAVCAEADFPDAFKVNMWVRGLSDDKNADEAMSEFKRFPTWMWRNKEVVKFLEWLRAHNAKLHHDEETRRQHCVGWYGLDVYSLNRSMQIVVDYLNTVDPKLADIAKRRYSCFDRFGDDAMKYGMALMYGYQSCEAGALKELKEMRRIVANQRESVQGNLAAEEHAFAALANAMVVADAERYYRNMFFADEITWNIRDKHMVDTAELLRDHLKKRGIQNPKLVIWAHNSHLGDARATDMGKMRGEFNIGQLVRQRHASQDPNKVYNIGFTTHCGSVTAADNWDHPPRLMTVNPSRPDSYEFALHKLGTKAFALDLRNPEEPGKAEVLKLLRGPKLERAIGVIYRPDTERWSHYFNAWLPEQFDMVLHIDKTHAVHPLEWGTMWEPEEREPPETYPFAV